MALSTFAEYGEPTVAPIIASMLPHWMLQYKGIYRLGFAVHAARTAEKCVVNQPVCISELQIFIQIG